LKDWLGVGNRELPLRPGTLEQLVDELQYIKNETDYISAVVDSTQGLLQPADVERVIALTKVLERVNQRISLSCR